jgi:hypothetical protein
MLEIVMKFYAEPLHKTSGIAALEFLYYRTKIPTTRVKKSLKKRDIIY